MFFYLYFCLLCSLFSFNSVFLSFSIFFIVLANIFQNKQVFEIIRIMHVLNFNKIISIIPMKYYPIIVQRIIFFSLYLFSKSILFFVFRISNSNICTFTKKLLYSYIFNYRQIEL